MGHEICYMDYPARKTLAQITKDVIDTVRHSGDRYGTDRVRIPTCKVFDTSREALEYIRSVDNGDYDGIAVQFKDYSKLKDTKKMEEYRAKITETAKKKDKYIKAHSIHLQKAVYATCPTCGSKLKRELVNGERCPLCRTDLRTASTLERIASFDAKVKELNDKFSEEQKKQKEKAETRWLVKYEFHT